ncbi:MAG: hypothetical protein R3Y06_09545 [Faecalibacterium sp.]
MAKLVISKSMRTASVQSIKIKKMTNSAYDAAAKMADERIERNNRNYAVASERASRCSAK